MRNALLCTTAVMLCLSVAPATAQQAITTPILSSVENFRDLAGIAASVNGFSTGGTGLVDTTSNNGVMRTGVFYRSNQLHGLSDPNLATISTLNIRLDIDLRTPSEYDPTWTPPPPGIADRPFGATLVHVNIYGNASYPPAAPAVTVPEWTAISYMQGMYVGFVTDQTQRSSFRTVLLDLANEEAAALWHCSGGKDRTGWTSMLLQTIAGVSPTTILNDYVATNIYTKAFIDAGVLAAIAQTGDPGVEPTARALLGVKDIYLQAGLDQVTAPGYYASVMDYLLRGVGLTQADVYVLRAKMVYYATLPGQSGLTGNAAAGAAFLGALQNSPLSGHYTNFNYYLQSAIDAGTLGGVETQAGGQVHADAAAQLLRLPVWLDGAITPHVSGRDLRVGQTRLWLANGGGYFSSDGHDGITGSTEQTAGSVIGATQRIDSRTSVYMGVGYNWGSVGSAGASADMDTGLATIGGRYGFSSLDSGVYVAARANVGVVDDHSKRALGGGLGTATGHATGAVYGARADIGDVIRLAPVTITPQIGLRVTRLTLGGFSESGSDLALAVDGIRQTSSTVVADLDVSLDPQKFGDWTVAPSGLFGYERALDNPQVATSASLYGITVNQYSAYDSRYLVKAGLALTAQRQAWIVKGGVNALIGEQASAGLTAQLSVSYRF
jgi:protein-tyrosine phosphatase